jgi:hypothetical protein
MTIEYNELRVENSIKEWIPMIQVFCASRGAGKTKKLIKLANEFLHQVKGDSVYIDNSSKNMMHLKMNIRFINTGELGIADIDSFYGLLCGVISQNYDVENIYIDNLDNIVNLEISESMELFTRLKEFSQRFKVNLFINMDCDSNECLPEFIKEYVA